MVHGWMRRVSKRLVSKRREKEEAPTSLCTHQPLYGKWVDDFMRKQEAGRFMLGKYLSDKKIPWRRRRQLGMTVA